jgi:hypothetical protein
VASRLNRLREASVRPLCVPSFLAATTWVLLLLAAKVSGGHDAAGLWSGLPYLVAMASTLFSPVCAAIAVVLTAVSTTHRPFAEVRSSWTMIGAALVCTVLSFAALAHEVPLR